jgi:FtsZ-interacting cell division protein ZipA
MITTLQIVLAIVGIGLIGAIVIYNLVQERRFRKEADRLFSHKREDIMLGESVRTESSRRQGETRIQLTGQEDSSPEARQAVEQAEAPLEVSPSHDDAPFTIQNMQYDEPEAIVSEAPLPPLLPREPEVVVTRPPASSDVLTQVPSAPIRNNPYEADEEYGIVPPIMPAHRPTAEPASPAAAEAPVFTLSSSLDSGSEYIARLKFANPAFTSYAGLLGSLRRIGKPVRAFGLRGDSDWEALTSNPRSAYSQMELGLQLADRAGALAADQLDSFCRALYSFAADAGGAVSCPDKGQALERARVLDLFCMDVDVLMGLNVIASEGHPFTSEAIHTQARNAGLVLESDGVYHAREQAGGNLFSLASQDEQGFPRDGRGMTTRGVTLLFDVPRVADGINVFDRMTEFGFALADRLAGRMVDDNGRAVSNESLSRDRVRLVDIYARMEKHEIPAGGERALRLFA